MNKPIETLTLQFDGGCKPTNPGNRYGSYALSRTTRSQRTFPVLHAYRFELGHGTSNEVEFLSLQRGLDDALKDMSAGGCDPSRYHITILTDSMIVMGHLTDPMPILSKHERTRAMQIHARFCLDRIRKFGAFSVDWISREKNVSAFGH